MAVEQEAVDEPVEEVPDSEQAPFYHEALQRGLTLVEGVAGEARTQELGGEEVVGETVLEEEEEAENGSSQVGLVSEGEGESSPELSSGGEGQVEQAVAKQHHEQEPEAGVAFKGSQHEDGLGVGEPA